MHVDVISTLPIDSMVADSVSSENITSVLVVESADSITHHYYINTFMLATTYNQKEMTAELRNTNDNRTQIDYRK